MKKKGMSKSTKKVLKIVIPILLVIVVVGAILANSAANAGEAMAQAMKVEAAKVEKGDVTETVETSGTVVSGQQKTFFSPVNATVKTASFQVGDMVNAGDKLVEFNLDDLEEQNQKAELTVKANSLGYQDSVNKSAQAAQTQADAKNKAATLQQQVDAKKQEVANLTSANAGDAQAQAAALQQASDSITSQIAALQQQQSDMAAVVEQNRTAYSNAQVAQQNAQVNFDAATASGNAADIAAASETLKAANTALSSAKNDYDTNKAQLDSITAQITALQADTSVGTSENGNTQLQQKLSAAQSELAELQAQLESQKAIAEADSATLSKEAKAQMQTNNNLAELEQKSLAELIEAGKNGISAEFNGVISDNQILEGATVSQGMQLLTVQSIDDVNVSVSLSKNVYEKVKEGQKAIITFAGQTYEGTVTKISRIASSGGAGGSNQAATSTSITATVHIDNPDSNIFLGVEAKVSIHAAEAKNVVILPTEAVNIGKDGSFCWVCEDGVLKKRSIETGVTSDDCIEITKGLKEGEEVIADPGENEEGDSITITSKTEAE